MKNVFLSLFFSLFSFSVLSNVGFVGEYIVPVESEDLKDVAKFEIQNIKLNHKVLSFKLSEKLGSLNLKSVQFVRDESNSNLFRSTFGIANCQQNSINTIKCKLEYNKIYSQFLIENLRDTEALLRNLSLDESEISRRMKVVEKFAGDPIGELIIFL